MKANGTAFKYGDNVDTDVIIPARYLAIQDRKELAEHCMEDIGKHFISQDWEWFDVTIRCYLLGQAIAEVLEEMR